MFKKIIWALLEVATIGSGTYVFVATIVDEYGIDRNEAGLGAFLIVLGLLLRNWRMTLFIKKEKSEGNSVKKPEIQSNSVNILLILILSLSMFILNKKINGINSNVDSNESEIQKLDSRINEFNALEHRLDNVESFEERIEDLENYSHRHY